ncbi:MAG: DegV family protein [Bacteroidales bacterium]|nr:DegV family protein [Bacteroidales bacterium]
MLTLFTDTDADFTPKVAAEYGYKLISMPFSIDGKTTYPYEEEETFDFKSYYDLLRSGVIPTTSALSEQSYLKYFEPEFAAGNDIFYVHISGTMTASIAVMRQAVEKLKAKYPERKFYALDTYGITIISYLIAREVGDLFNAGKTPEEVMEWGKKEVPHFAQYFFADDLKFFRRSGRVSGLAATMGGLIGIRPIIYMNEEGKMLSIAKETGRVKAVEHLVNKVAELGDDLQHHRIIIGHTDAGEIAKQVENRLRERLGADLNIETVMTNPTAGAHCGPNGVGVAFHAIHK